MSVEVAEPPTVPWPVELEPAEVAERFRWARRRGHPRYLWPEVPAGSWRAASRELERVVEEVLAGGRPALGGGVPPRALGVAGFTSGVGPLVGRWLEDGRVVADALTARVFALHLWHGRKRAEGRAAELERAVGLLNGAGIEPLVVKSAQTALRYFPEPGTRPGADVDLVVPAAAYDRAEGALVAGGYEREGGQRSPRKTDLRFRGGVRAPRSLELSHGESGCGVDLHDGLTRDFFGVRRVTVSDVEGGSEPASSGSSASSGRYRILRQPERLAYHALHASEGLENLTLIRLVELTLMIRVDVEAGILDWGSVLSVLEAAGGTRFAYPALALTERLAPGTVDPRVLAVLSAAATPRMRRVVGGLGPSDAQRLESLSLEERFMWSDSPLEHARRLAHMLVPAAAGRSPGRIARTYRERLWRLTRRRVAVRRAGGGQSPG